MIPLVMMLVHVFTMSGSVGDRGKSIKLLDSLNGGKTVENVEV
jgi:hypothetical protein